MVASPAAPPGIPAADTAPNEVEVAVEQMWASRHAARLSMPFPVRLPLASSLAFVAGAGLGLSHGATEAGLRFRAENAHRFPTSQVGWYLYHKSKNYHMALGGIREAFRMGLKQAGWVGVFIGMEEFIDRGRAGVMRAWRGVRGVNNEEDRAAGSRDFLSSVLAGMGTAGAFSAWNRFPVPTAARVAKMGAKVGLAYGLLQDAVGLLRGRRLGYVDFIRRHTWGMTDEEKAIQPK